VRRRMPSRYVTAQRVDRRMGLADALSTAVFFNQETGAPRASSELRQWQLADAERVAAGVDVRRAIPYAFPRTAYAAAALLLVASSVFALRYGLMDRLDLKQPLARILQQRLGYGEPDKQARLDQRQSQKQLSGDDPLATEEGQRNDPAQLDQQPGDAAENYSEESKQSAAKADAKSKNDQSEADANEDGQADQSEQPADGQNANPKNGQKESKDSQTGSPNSQNSQNNQNLLSKMKDAMQNLLSSLQQNPREQQNANNQNGKGNKGQQNQNKQQSKGEKSKSQTGDSQDQQAAEDSQEAQNSQGQSAEQQDSLANKQPGSGAGNRDGAKDVRQAEQLAAMGKISEIIGKRAANVTGEATVDVQNTSQQLRTSYQDRRSEHAQSGAEINRDEIPVALESYVQQYFEQVRKQAPPKQ